MLIKSCVSDDQPPTIDKCVSPEPFRTGDADLKITWEEPVFHDNSGQPVSVTQSHTQYDEFALGLTKVTYTATDATGNNSTCVIEILVQGIYLFIYYLFIKIYLYRVKHSSVKYPMGFSMRHCFFSMRPCVCQSDARAGLIIVLLRHMNIQLIWFDNTEYYDHVNTVNHQLIQL